MIKLYGILLFVWQLLFGAWTTPKTWTAEPLTSSDLNTYIRDNQNDIRARQDNNADHIADQGSDYTTTSTSFTDVDGTNLSLTITTNGGDVIVCFVASIYIATSNSVHLNISVDGSNYFNNDGFAVVRDFAGDPFHTRGYPLLITGLSAGSHTFRIRWKVTGGTAILYAGAGTSNLDVHPQFWVQEM